MIQVHQNEQHVATVQTFTAQLNSINNGDNVHTTDNTLLEYFAEIHAFRPRTVYRSKDGKYARNPNAPNPISPKRVAPKRTAPKRTAPKRIALIPIAPKPVAIKDEGSSNKWD
jgi:hypothetical protein